MSFVNYHATHAANPFSIASLPLNREEIGGNFSLLEKRPIIVDAIQGLTLYLRSGVVQICHPEEEGQYLVEAGDSIVLKRNGPVSLVAIARAELQLDWPAPKTAMRADVVETNHYAYA